jgi:predicted DNA-binding mobile mystery protein A
MKPEFRKLRLKQLEKGIEPYLNASKVQRPRKGWIRAIREVTGVTLRELASRMRITHQTAFALEKNEADFKITLRALEAAADALGCKLVYALVPKNSTLEDLATTPIRKKAAEEVRRVEHSMALENQAVGNVDEKIEETVERLLKKRNKR